MFALAAYGIRHQPVDIPVRGGCAWDLIEKNKSSQNILEKINYASGCTNVKNIACHKYSIVTRCFVLKKSTDS